MLKFVVLPLLAFAIWVQVKPDCTSLEEFSEQLKAQVHGTSKDDLLVLDGKDGTKILTEIGVDVKGRPIEGVTNVLVYEKAGITAMFVFIKGCYVGHVTGSNSKSPH
jgi:hypothetical protein